MSLDPAGYSDPSPIRQPPGQDMLIVAGGAGAVNCSGLLWPVQGARLQQSCWELVEDLAFCRERYPRLAELAALLLFEQQ
jgi:hypothetical protein